MTALRSVCNCHNLPYLDCPNREKLKGAAQSNYFWVGDKQEPNPPRCECHECTQARWKMSIQGQIAGAFQKSQQIRQEFAAKEVPPAQYAAQTSTWDTATSASGKTSSEADMRPNLNETEFPASVQGMAVEGS